MTLNSIKQNMAYFSLYLNISDEFSWRIWLHFLISDWWQLANFTNSSFPSVSHLGKADKKPGVPSFGADRKLKTFKPLHLCAWELLLQFNPLTTIKSKSSPFSALSNPLWTCFEAFSVLPKRTIMWGINIFILFWCTYGIISLNFVSH